MPVLAIAREAMPIVARAAIICRMSDSPLIRECCRSLALVSMLALPAVFGARAGLAEPAYGVAMHGQPALPADFTHFPHTNPDAPKGGTLRLAVTGSFDSLNPFIIKGSPAWHVRLLMFEPLLARNHSEPFSLYGLVAEKVDMPEDRTSITFHLNPKASFADGASITAKDVLFSWKTLRDHGRLNHRTYYRKVLKAEAIDEHTVKFTLDGKDRELPLILGLMPVLPAHWFKDRTFDKTTLEPMLGSGPYRLVEVKPGQKLVFERRKDYWGKDLPSRRGMFNHDRIIIDYYRDRQAAFEALKKGLVDIRFESDATRWATAYDFPAVKEGRFVQEVVPTKLPAPLSAFVFNTRRALFFDARVREALLHTFDFEWANANLFHGLYRRTSGYFDGSELSSIGRAADVMELRLMKQVGARLQERFIKGEWRAPVSDGSGRDRRNLRRAVQLLGQAGWRIAGGRMVHAKTGQPFSFELLIQSSEQEKIALHWQKALSAIGITMRVRLVDSAQFTRRLLNYDYDVAPYTWHNSLSPGNEQKFYWGSFGRKQPGTRNYAGIADKSVDATIEALIAARTRTELVAAARLLDRLLSSGFYVLPLYHAPGQWVGRWQHVKHPATLSLYGFQITTTWDGRLKNGK